MVEMDFAIWPADGQAQVLSAPDHHPFDDGLPAVSECGLALVRSMTCRDDRIRFFAWAVS